MTYTPQQISQILLVMPPGNPGGYVVTWRDNGGEPCATWVSGWLAVLKTSALCRGSVFGVVRADGAMLDTMWDAIADNVVDCLEG